MNSLRVIVFNERRLVSNLLKRTYSQEASKFETLAVSTPKKNVYHVELNRPDKYNSFNTVMWSELVKCFASLSSNPDCRVVILSGQGKHFTAGIDLNSFVKEGAKAAEIDDPARRSRFLYGMIQQYQDSITSLESCVKPVLSVVHSACVGAGVDLITAADVRYCTEDAWFQVKEVDVGLAADVGTLQRLPKVIGSTSTVRELCYTARKVNAKEAQEIGLVSRVFPNKEEALKNVLEIAENIAAKSPVAVQTSKINLVYSQSRPTEEGLMHIRLMNQVMLQSEDLTVAAVAQLTKGDKPEFEDM